MVASSVMNSEIGPPRENRTHMVMHAAMSSERLNPQEILVRNISASGIGARARGAPPHIGEQIVIAFDGIGRYQASVRWVSGNLFGAELTQRIDPSVFHFSSDWHNRPLPKPEPHFVPERFRPVSRAWRPGLKVLGG